MFGLPVATEIHKILAKNELFKFLQISKEKRNKIEEEIKRLVLIAEITPNSTHIQAGKKDSIFLLQVELKEQKISVTTLEVLAKHINQNLVFLLTYQEKQAKLAIFEKQLFQTEWQDREKINLSLQGIDLDQVWENFVLQIGNFSLDKQRSLGEEIAYQAQQTTLLKKINLLENKRNKEKQVKKKIALHKQIQELQALLQK